MLYYNVEAFRSYFNQKALAQRQRNCMLAVINERAEVKNTSNATV